MSEFIGDPERALRQIRSDWQSAGLLQLPHAAHVEDVTASVNQSATAVSSLTAAEASPAPHSSVPQTEPTRSAASASEFIPRPNPETKVSASPLSRTEREEQLAELAKSVSQCTRCQELAGTRTQTVFGVGNPEATVMFVGEAPGADEDAQGEPFVGRAGQLLNKIIAACGWQREDIYICNILRCRPPGNRNPSTEEAANCREYLDGQIQLVDPDYIVCWGSVASQNLLDQTVAIGKLRQKWLQYGRAKVLCTYHPSYLLRNPAAKKPVWEDMQLLLAEMGLEPPPQ